MIEVLLHLINFPLRLILGIGIITLLLFKREVPDRLWDLVHIPRPNKVIPLQK